ncbi:unnamed protein product [Bursaphelenchus okinawaensis]|uniref:Uncharacterized protein n=1 Tax=Bursaphelenchus okinawaensis TaxID=465554 RepID=A0A811KWU4_9BILA|nr:unnamed protein product [Bursaphelenchus okinawaensis]CAG9112567.1 unnamed protein product [Bursaphelenchus okinawaensis]
MVVITLLLLSSIVPLSKSADPWQIYLCNLFAVPEGYSGCDIKKHPFHIPALEPALPDLSRAVQDSVRSTVYNNEDDSSLQMELQQSGEPLFVKCKQSKDFNIFMAENEPLVEKILRIPDEKKRLETITKLGKIVTSDNTEELMVDTEDLNVECVNSKNIGEPAKRLQPIHFKIGLSLSGNETEEAIADQLEKSSLKRVLPIQNYQLNLQLDIKWMPWSCCSACCCSNDYCGVGYGVSEKKCKALQSHRSRMGYVSFMKVDKDKPVNINNLLKDHNNSLTEAEAAEVSVEFDNALSSNESDFIPLFSHFFHSDIKRTHVEEALNMVFKFRGETPDLYEVLPTDSQPFGRYGKVIEDQECDQSNPQKQSCSELDRCRRLHDQGIVYFTTTTTTFKPKVEDNSWKKSCQLVEFVDIVVDEEEESFLMKVGLNYRISLQIGLFDDDDKMHWQLGTSDIVPYDWSKSCSEQDLVVLPDNKSILLMGFSKEMVQTVITASVICRNHSNSYFVKFHIPYEEIASKYNNSILKWSGIIAGVISCLLVLVALQVYYEIRKKQQMIKELIAELEPPEEEPVVPAVPTPPPEGASVVEAEGVPTPPTATNTNVPNLPPV